MPWVATPTRSFTTYRFIMPAAGAPRKGLLLDCPVIGRASWVSLERGRLEVDGHCLALVQDGGVVEVPPAAFAAILIEPGVTVTHAAVRLCAENLTSIIWTGEAGTRLYAASHLHADASRLLTQARLHMDAVARIEAARRLYSLMFSEAAPPSFSLEKLRGVEGARVKAWYRDRAKALSLQWDQRTSDSDLQRCISFAAGCLNDLAHIAVTLLGYSPAIGIVHSGDARSFVYDLADTVKFEPFLGRVMEWFAHRGQSDYRAVRQFSRDCFWECGMLDTMISNAEYIVNGHGRPIPSAA